MLPLQKAKYQAKASMQPISFGESQNGNMQIAVEFEVIDHPELAGETITWIGHFTELTSERTLESLVNAGWLGDDVSELAGAVGADMLPDPVYLTCDVEEYDGKERLRVQWVNKARSAFKFKQEADASQLRSLGARLRATVKSLRASGGGNRATGRQEQRPAGRRSDAQHPNAPGARDDIPF